MHSLFCKATGNISIMKRKRITERGARKWKWLACVKSHDDLFKFFHPLCLCPSAVLSVFYRGNFKPPDHHRCLWFAFLTSLAFHATTHRSPPTRRPFHVNPQGIRTCCFWCSLPRWPTRRHRHSASPTQPNHYSVYSIDVSGDDWSCGKRPAKAWASQTGRYRFSTLLIALDMSDTTSDSSQSLWPRSRSIQTDSISRAILVMSRNESRDVRYGRDCRSLSFGGTFLGNAPNFAWPVLGCRLTQRWWYGYSCQERGEERERGSMIVCVMCVGGIGNVWVKCLRVWLMEGKAFSLACGMLLWVMVDGGEEMWWLCRER